MAARETVLVVDDDKFNVALMRELCESAGYHVVEAHDGNEAIDKALSAPPDLVLLDIMMAGKDGFEVCRYLRSRDETAELPIIMVTALDDLNSMSRGIELGADDYVTKPFKLFELQQRLRTAIETRRTRRQLRDLERKLKELDELDMPGGVGGYRQLRHNLEYEFKRAQRYEHPLSCILFSIDNYDGILSEQGQEVITDVVGATVRVLNKHLRSVDRIYRVHDNEFILLLPETPQRGAVVAINRIREGLGSPPIEGLEPIRITASVAAFPHPSIKTAQGLLRQVNDLHRASSGKTGDCVAELTE